MLPSFMFCLGSLLAWVVGMITGVRMPRRACGVPAEAAPRGEAAVLVLAVVVWHVVFFFAAGMLVISRVIGWK